MVSLLGPFIVQGDMFRMLSGDPIAHATWVTSKHKCSWKGLILLGKGSLVCYLIQTISMRGMPRKGKVFHMLGGMFVWCQWCVDDEGTKLEKQGNGCDTFWREDDSG